MISCLEQMLCIISIKLDVTFMDALLSGSSYSQGVYVQENKKVGCFLCCDSVSGFFVLFLSHTRCPYSVHRLELHGLYI